MIAATSGISILDGIAQIARAAVARPAAHAPAVTPIEPPRPERYRDRVEISAEGRRASGKLLAEPGGPGRTATAKRFDQLNEEEKRLVRELRRQDGDVRAHEQAHKAAAGSHAGPISYTYAVGPDGRRYASGGEVPIDVSPVEGDPQATIRKMEQVRRAALAPSNPSTADRQVAARARQIERQARAEAPGGKQHSFHVDVFA